ncbi:MAG: hypothetical protein KME21_04110 [Desmonostoc vinosum HA7617-LM4]|jgi:hypothetical protein|nr:hypothetical protein [Desmonostoc vinosum HA7617-LM4]
MFPLQLSLNLNNLRFTVAELIRHRWLVQLVTAIARRRANPLLSETLTANEHQSSTPYQRWRFATLRQSGVPPTALEMRTGKGQSKFHQ